MDLLGTVNSLIKRTEEIEEPKSPMRFRKTPLVQSAEPLSPPLREINEEDADSNHVIKMQ